MKALLLLPLLAALAPQDTADLSWKPKVGEKLEYAFKIDSSFDAGGQSMAIQVGFDLTSTVTKIDEDVVTLEDKMSNMTFTMNGQKMDGMMGGPGADAEPPVTVRNMRLSGKIDSVEVKGGGSGPMDAMGSARMQALNVFMRPAGPIEIGKEWFAEVKGDKAAGTEDVKARFKVLGSETIGQRNAWKIETVVSEMAGERPMGAIGTLWVEKATGNMVKMEQTIENVSFAPQMPPIAAKVTINRKPAR